MKWILKCFAAIVGPAAFMAAGTMGAGGTGSLLLAGVWFGYDLLWVAVITLPLFVICVDSATRIGALNRNTGMFSLIRERLHPSIAWLLFALNVPLYLLIAMSHMSVMTSSLRSLLMLDSTSTALGGSPGSPVFIDFALAVVCAGILVRLATSSGYQRLQTAMTVLMLLMVTCFAIVALHGFVDIGAILGGLVPHFPEPAVSPDGQITRTAVGAAIAVVGSLLAPPAMLGIPYMSADERNEAPDLRALFRKSVINLGVIVGIYCVCLMVAGGFALHGLPNHASIDTVEEARGVLGDAFPAGLRFLGTAIFSLGLFIAAMTTFVVVAELMSYFILDMFNKPWHQTAENRSFKALVAAWLVVPAVLAPFWDLPELFKVVLLMGANTIVVPLVILSVILLVNRSDVMGPHRARATRNVILVIALILAMGLAVAQLPDFVRAFLA